MLIVRCKAFAKSATAAIAAGIAAHAIAQPSMPPLMPQTPAGWREAARSDLAHIRAQLTAHTPIPHSPAVSELHDWLEKGYAEALAKLELVKGEADWFYALAFYVNGFREPHIYLSGFGELPPARWPGFMVAASGENAVVVESDPADPAVPSRGEVITRCDGKALSDLAGKLVFPYVMNDKLPAEVHRATSRLFIYRDNSFFSPLVACDRVNAAGMALPVLALSWRSVPTEKVAAEAWWRRYQAIAMGPAPEFGVSDAAEGVVWISVPTFASGPATTPKLEALLDSIQKRGDGLRNGRAIVLDTRGNGGGNSLWAARIAEAVFGKEVLRRHAMPGGGEAGIDWRVSPENIEYWREWADKMIPEVGRFSLKRLGTLSLVGRMQAALEDGNPLYREGSARAEASRGGVTAMRKRQGGGESPFRARVYVLSNGSCGSACLDFADKVLFVPGAALIGTPTSGDGLLMDIRFSALPSGLAKISLPMKVALGRARGNLEFYDVDARYAGRWDDGAVREWVRAQIARDLSMAAK